MNLFTLRQAQEFVIREREDPEGIDCPCCGQLCKVYVRRIHSTMARWLIALCWRHKFDERWFSVHEDWSLAFNIGDVGKLAYWSLVIQKPKDPEDTSRRTSGLWKPTPEGLEFVRGNLLVLNAALVFDGDVIGWIEDPLLSIHDCIGKKWDYQELMREGVRSARR